MWEGSVSLRGVGAKQFGNAAGRGQERNRARDGDTQERNGRCAQWGEDSDRSPHVVVLMWDVSGECQNEGWLLCLAWMGGD